MLVLLVILLAVDQRHVRGPRAASILGDATNLIFEGAISAQMPAGATQEQVIAGLRASGQDQLADMLSSMTLTPGQGIDFAALGQTLLVLVGVYVLSSLFAWLQGYDHGRRHPADRLPAARRTSTRSSAGCRCATSTATPGATS